MATKQDVVVLDAHGRPVLLHEESLHYVDAWKEKDLKKLPLSFRSSSAASTSSSRFSTTKSDHHLHPHHKYDHKHHKHRHDDIDLQNAHQPTPKIIHYDETDRPNQLAVENRGYDTLSKRPPASVLKTSESFRSSGKGSARIHFGPLKSSTLKRSRSETSLNDGVVTDFYSLPRKSGKKKKSKFGKKKSSSLKYINDPGLYQQDYLSPMTAESGGMFERNPSFREGMKGGSESHYPVHTLDPYALPGANHHFADGPDVCEHVISFRSYPSPEMSKREKVIYLNPSGQRSYQRLQPSEHHHSYGELQPASGRNSLHSSRSSLVKY